MIQHSKPYYNDEDIESVVSTIKASYTASMGPKTRELQNELKNYYNAEKVVLTSSASMALVLALIINGVKEYDKVLIPTYICSEVRDAILMLGAIPVLSDINKKNYSIDENILKTINVKLLKTVIVPHMFGISADVEPLLKFQLPLIEDLAQGLGAFYKNKPVGCLGKVSIISFKSIKMLGAGEGGALIINDKGIAESFDSVIEEHYISSLYAMSDLTAALALSQFKKLDFFVSKRSKIANIYLNKFKNLNVNLPSNIIGNSWYRFFIEPKEEYNFIELKKEFENLGVQIRKPVDILLHHKYPDQFNSSSYTISENVFKKIISIPIYPALKDDEINIVCDACIKLLS